MKQAKSHVTLLVGPQTRLAIALNDAIRTHRAAIASAGVKAFPNRIATRALRAATVDDLTDDERREILVSTLLLNDDRPVFLSAINLLGAPTAAYRRQELFPSAERKITGPGSPISKIVERVVLTIEPLHHFLMSLKTPTLHERVAAAPWEALYELSWSDLVAEISEAFPTSQLMIVTPDAAFVGAKAMLSELLGAASIAVDPKHLQRPHLTPDGQVAFDRICATQEPDAEKLERLFTACRTVPDQAELESQLGIDKLTSTLLDQRYREDLDLIEAMPRVRLL